MLSILSRYLGDASPLAFLVLFLGLFLLIVGGALWLTPRLAKWLERKDREERSYYDGILEEDPRASGEDGERKRSEEHHV